ncbi:hypothetical protein, partial [Vibrio metoecus]|uniref:hypothetical protein n=1 Tax=Vibrio metoecus TaxID=1481663 RepID=UPI00159629AB
MRIYTRIVIKLFFLFISFPFISLANPIDKVDYPYSCVDYLSRKIFSGIPNNDVNGCFDFVNSSQNFSKCDLIDSSYNIKSDRNNSYLYCSGPSGTFKLIERGSPVVMCPSGYSENPDGTCSPKPPQCNADEILNPETNTCEPAG